ncbi:MAG: hypothetical protein AAGH43_11205 [Pseudomonadota bacterium]
MLTRLLASLSVAAGLFIAGPVVTQPTVWAGGVSGNLDGSELPHCDAPGVLSRIVEKAAYRGQAPHQHPVAITAFDHIHQTRYVSSPGAGLRERRWCQARAYLENGHRHTAYYLIESHASFVAVSYGVESCLSGRDLWNVYGGDCSALRLW